MNVPSLSLDFGDPTSSLLDAPRMLLEQLQLRGVTVEVNGAKLLLDAPRGALEDLLPDIQKFKPALLELLENDAARERFPVHLRAHFRDEDQVGIGRCLLRLDAGLDIENEE